MIWNTFKRGFGAWEQATAQYMEKVMANPSVLGPAGAALTAVAKTKTVASKALTTWWSVIGLPTRRDQERSLHKLNQLETRMHDLEEQLAAQQAPAAQQPDLRIKRG